VRRYWAASKHNLIAKGLNIRNTNRASACSEQPCFLIKIFIWKTKRVGNFLQMIHFQWSFMWSIIHHHNYRKNNQ